MVTINKIKQKKTMKEVKKKQISTSKFLYSFDNSSHSADIVSKLILNDLILIYRWILCVCVCLVLYV